jgi:hypothetical protein
MPAVAVPGFELILVVAPFVGAALLVLSFYSRTVPGWLFPVRGRWLAYLLRGVGAVLLLPWLSQLPTLILGVVGFRFRYL